MKRFNNDFTECCKHVRLPAIIFYSHSSILIMGEDNKMISDIIYFNNKNI